MPGDATCAKVHAKNIPYSQRGVVTLIRSSLPRSALSALGRWLPMSHRILLAGSLSCLLAACTGDGVTYDGIEDTTQTPQGRFEPDVGDPNRQTIFGAGGISNLWSDDSNNGGSGGGLGVNAFLWRASLDTFAFLPPISTDPLGGVIIYDWYASPETPNERFKVSVYILGTKLRADGVNVQVNRQLRGADGSWYEAAVDPATPASLEDAVLTRARQMRIAQLGQ